MRKTFRRALVVGKFSPLHRGHEYLLSQAQAATETLVVISYAAPEHLGCGAAQRESWLRALYPQARLLVIDNERLTCLPLQADWAHIPPDDAPEIVHRRFCADLCLDVLGGPIDAVFTSETYGDGFADFLSEAFRRVHPGAPRVAHVQLDVDRKHVAICATRIRANVHAERRWLNPIVYASFVERVCFLGGESTGKSSLAEAMAQLLNTAFVPEYGRTLWEEKAGALAYEDMVAIAQSQSEMEDRSAEKANKYLFCDTSPLTTLFYSDALFKKVDTMLVELARRYYHYVFLCAPDFDFVQDGTRQDCVFRDRQHAWYMEQLDQRGIPYTLVAGPLDKRISQVCAKLGAER